MSATTNTGSTAPNASETTLSDFLLARIAEDEVVAEVVRSHQAVDPQPVTDGYRWWEEYDLLYAPPRRVLAECEAKRRIVGLHRFYPERECWECDREYGPCETLRLLALPYADHPDYRKEWRP